MTNLVYKIVRPTDNKIFEVVKYGDKNIQVDTFDDTIGYRMSARTFVNALPPFPDPLPPFRSLWEAVKYTKDNLEFLY